MSSKNVLLKKANNEDCLNIGSLIKGTNLKYSDVSKVGLKAVFSVGKETSCVGGNLFEISVKAWLELPAFRSKNGKRDITRKVKRAIPNCEIKSCSSPLSSISGNKLIIYCPIPTESYTSEGYFNMLDQEAFVMPKEVFIKMLKTAGLMRDGNSHIQTFYVWKTGKLNCGGKYRKMLDFLYNDERVVPFLDWCEEI